MPAPLALFFTGGMFARIMYFMVASAVVRVAAAIGLTIVSFTGINLVFGEIESFIDNSLGGLSSYITSILELYGLMFSINIMISTMAAVLAIKSLVSFKKLAIK